MDLFHFSTEMTALLTRANLKDGLNLLSLTRLQTFYFVAQSVHLLNVSTPTVWDDGGLM